MVQDRMFALRRHVAFLWMVMGCGANSPPRADVGIDSSTDSAAIDVRFVEAQNDSVLDVIDASDAARDASVPSTLEGITGGATAVTVASGFQFLEGPVWHSAGYLLFSDTNTNTIHRFSPGSGASIFRTPSNGTNGLAFDNQENLIMNQVWLHRVVRLDGSNETVLASMFAALPFDQPNDVVVASDGAIYFSDSCFGCTTVNQSSRRLYRISLSDVEVIASDFMQPNGLELSPDGSTLYLSDTGANALYAIDLSTRTRTLLATVAHPDGIAVDANGFLYLAVRGEADAPASWGVDVFTPVGARLGRIATAEQPSNCTFGGADRETLYITAGSMLQSIRLRVQGR